MSASRGTPLPCTYLSLPDSGGLGVFVFSEVARAVIQAAGENVGGKQNINKICNVHAAAAQNSPQAAG